LRLISTSTVIAIGTIHVHTPLSTARIAAGVRPVVNAEADGSAAFIT
jgi:hypothetical protein